jgi:hypothetical protein
MIVGSNEGFFFQSSSKEKLVLNLEAKDVMNVRVSFILLNILMLHQLQPPQEMMT